MAITTGREDWHDWAPTLRSYKSAVSKNPTNQALLDEMREQVKYILSDKRVVFYKHGKKDSLDYKDVTSGNTFDFSKFNRMYYGNRHGKSYEAMGVSDMGEILSQMALVTSGSDRVFYTSLSLAALGNLTDIRSARGLRWSRRDHTFWFHARTDQDNNKPGGTLNKHLSAVRKLQNATENLSLLPDLVDPGTLKKFRKFARGGFEKLTHGGFPSIADYVPVKGKDPVKEAWLYYGMDCRKKKGYYLDHSYKNGNYHIYIMRMIYSLYNNPNFIFDESLWKKKDSTLGATVPKWLWGTYRAKEKDGFYKNSKSSGKGEFKALDEDRTGEDELLDDAERQWYQSWDK